MSFLTVIKAGTLFASLKAVRDRIPLRGWELAAVAAVLLAVVVFTLLWWRGQQLDRSEAERRMAEEALAEALEIKEQERASSVVDLDVVTAFMQERERLREEQGEASRRFIEGYLELPPSVFPLAPTEQIEAVVDAPTQAPPPPPQETGRNHVPTTPHQSDDRVRTDYLIDSMWDHYCNTDPTHVRCSP